MTYMRKIPVETALRDLLREYGISLQDLLIAIQSENIDVYNELIARLEVKGRDVTETVFSIPWSLAAITLFTIQALYLMNPSGLYKGYLLDPKREEIVAVDKVRFYGLLRLVSRLRSLL